MATVDGSSNGSGLRYWLIILALVVFGFVTIFSVGVYFWFVAIALLVLSPLRSRPRLFRSGIAMFLGFLVGYVLIAPWGCSQSSTFDPTGETVMSPVVCTSPIGIEYSGTEPFVPSRTPALLVAGVFAVIASAVTWVMTDGGRHSHPGT